MAKANLASSISDQIAAAQASEAPVLTVVPEVVPAVSNGIRKGKPLPKPIKGKSSTHPWDELEVNDSFFVPGAKITTWYTAISTKNKANPDKRFYATKDTEDGVEGVGVWRIK